MKPYRQLEHTADLRLRIQGGTLRSLFRNALFAVADLLTDASKVRKVSSQKLKVRGENAEILLIRFLREILFLFDTRRFLPRRLEFIRLEDKILEAKIWGEKFSPGRHPLKTEIKAVTYHGLKVERRRGRWVAEVVFDV